MRIRADGTARGIEAKSVQHFTQHIWRLQLPVSVKREPAAGGGEHDTPTREVFVLVPRDQGWQASPGKASGSEPAPAFPYLVVSAQMGEEIADPPWFPWTPRGKL